MDFVVAIILGWIGFWVLYAVLTWALNTALAFWSLAVWALLHWLVYWALYVTLTIGFDSTFPTALGWFVLGPIIGGVWLTLRQSLAAFPPPEAELPPGEEVPLTEVRISMGKRVLVSSTLGVMNFLLVTGAVVPIILGVIYTVLTWYRLVP